MPKKVFVLWSGGLDSTYTIMHYLKLGYCVEAGYIHVLNNETKSEMELDAISKLSNILSTEYSSPTMTSSCFEYVGKICSVEVHRAVSNVVLKQVPLWMLGMTYSVRSDVDIIAIGYIANDCALSYIDDIKRMYRSYMGLFEEKRPRLEFPLIKVQKSEILSGLPKNLSSLCVRCERPIKRDGVFIPCHMCTPCKHYDELTGVNKYTEYDQLGGSPIYKEPSKGGEKISPVKSMNVIPNQWN